MADAPHIPDETETRARWGSFAWTDDNQRKANEVNGSARTEAESVAKLIREALGEPILVPPVAAASSPALGGCGRVSPLAGGRCLLLMRVFASNRRCARVL